MYLYTFCVYDSEKSSWVSGSVEKCKILNVRKTLLNPLFNACLFYDTHDIYYLPSIRELAGFGLLHFPIKYFMLDNVNKTAVIKQGQDLSYRLLFN